MKKITQYFTVLTVSLFTLHIFGQTLKVNYRDRIQQTIQALKNAKSYSEWKSSGLTAEDIFLDMTKSENSAIERQLFCNALLNFSQEEQSMFLSEIQELHPSQYSGCFKKIERSVQKFYKISTESIQVMKDLNTAFNLDNKGRGGNEIQVFSVRSNPEPWSNRVLEIDTIGGPRFVTADLPRKEIALTFDDGPHQNLTNKLLEILKKSGLKVTFFSVGKNMKKYPLIAQKILDESHTLGTHSWSHKQLTKVSRTEGVEQIERAFHQVLEQHGEAAPFFRFPYGARSKFLTQYLKENDISDFFWTVDTLDWKIKNPMKLYDYALKQIEKSGHGIVLFHDIQPQTIAMLPDLLDTLKARGYKHVTLKPKEMIKK